MGKTDENFKLFSVPSEKLVLMSVCTYSFYCWYWLFKNWSSICTIRKKSYSPLIRTWLFPFYNSNLFEEIKTLAEKNKIHVNWKPSIVAIGFLLILFLWYLPYMMFISIFAGLVFVPVNNTCSQINEAYGFQEEAQEGFSKNDWAIIIIGGIFVTMSLINAIMLSGILPLLV